MSAGGKRNRIAPLPMQVKRRSFAFNDEMENEEGCWRSIDNVKRMPGRNVCARVKRKSLSSLALHHLLTYFNIFSLLPSNTESFHLESKIFTEAKTTKISSTQASGALYVYFMMIVRSTECISGASREASFSGEAFSSRKVKNCFCFLLFFFFLCSQRDGKKTFRHLIFSFIL